MKGKEKTHITTTLRTFVRVRCHYCGKPVNKPYRYVPIENRWGFTEYKPVCPDCYETF